MTTAEFRVAGMACGHCVKAVTDELTALPGVADVAVDLSNELVTITSDRELAVADVRTAVEDAGYELVG